MIKEAIKLLPYTRQQKKNLDLQRNPVKEKEYMITDQCFWKIHPRKDYNPLDPERSPHSISLVDVATGTLVQLESGSIIKVVKVHHNKD